jgi:EAL domain-containing protein (putative c-di-GMP-specific phosphodiesterase class I)
VLRLAAGEAAAWPQLHTSPPAVAINLSTVPDDARISETLTRIIDRSGLDWTRLVLEITETRMAGLAEPAREVMQGLTERGARFALDDFGTGYSSLARLEALPVSILKLDKSFTTDLATNPVHHGITTATLGMATSMGQTCIAEGVETPNQFHILTALGYPAYQGFLLCPPVPAHELHTLISTGSLPLP